jgi:membrane-associated protease RseP (regulator of RpoE activity)
LNVLRELIYVEIQIIQRGKKLNLTLQLTQVDWLLIAAVFISIYSLLLLPIRNSEKWKMRGITTWGPIPLVIFMRTTHGLKLLDKLSQAKRFWRILATGGVPLVILSMGYFLAMLLLMTYLMIQEPPAPSSYNAPRNILLIPGLNEYIPFVWGWIALFVTMVVHEFAHGILSRVEGVRVKSMGIITFLFAPIAAFVEPDEEELFGSKDQPPKVNKAARIRILSAGVISNFLVAFIAMALFFGPVIGSISPLEKVVVVDVQQGSAGETAGFQRSMVLQEADGRTISNLSQLHEALSDGAAEVAIMNNDRRESLALNGSIVTGIKVASVFEGSPAGEAGMPSGTIIADIEGTKIGGLNDFRRYMNTTKPGQEIAVTAADGKIYHFALDANPNANGNGNGIDSSTDNSNKGFMGIGFSGEAAYTDAIYIEGVTFQQAPAKQFLAALKAIPESGLAGFTYLLGLPFAGIPGFTEKGFPGFSGWITGVFEPIGWAEPLGYRFFWIANMLLWIGWINLYAGLFNCLPAVPLDGGHIFRDLVQSGFERVVNVQKAERLTRTVVALLAWLVLTSLLITVVAPFTHSLSL